MRVWVWRVGAWVLPRCMGSCRGLRAALARAAGGAAVGLGGVRAAGWGGLRPLPYWSARYLVRQGARPAKGGRSRGFCCGFSRCMGSRRGRGGFAAVADWDWVWAEQSQEGGRGGALGAGGAGRGEWAARGLGHGAA